MFEDNRVRNKTVLSLINKQTQIDPKLQKFSVRPPYPRTMNPTPVNLNNNSSLRTVFPTEIKEKSFETEANMIVKTPNKPSEDEKEEIGSEHTTPSSKQSILMNTNEKKNAVDYGYSLDKKISR